jgi:hypothetical protein
VLADFSTAIATIVGWMRRFPLAASGLTIVLIGGLAACSTSGGSTAHPVPAVPTATPSGSASPSPTPTPTPHGSGSPSPTPSASPSPTPTATPTHTPSPTPSPSPSPNPNATALVYVPVGNAGRGDGIDVFSYTYATHALALVGSIFGSNTQIGTNDPAGIAVDESGNIYLSLQSVSPGIVYEYAAGSGSSGTANVAPIRTITTPTTAEELWAAHGLVYINGGNGGGTITGTTYVYGPGSNTVPILSIPSAVANSASTAIISDAAGNMYIANHGPYLTSYPANDPQIFIYNSAGTQIGTITNGDADVFSMAFDPSGNLVGNNYWSQTPPPPYVCCSLVSWPAASLLSNPTATLLASGSFGAANAIAIDTHGDYFGTNQNLYVYAAGSNLGGSPTTTVTGLSESTFNVAVYPHP